MNYETSSQLEERFRKLYGSNPDIVARAPGRVNLIGEHTDYNDGFVLPVAIDRTIVMVARCRSDSLFRLSSSNFNESISFDITDLRKEQLPRWSDYPRGVIDEFLKLGYEITGMEAFITSNLPIAAGLSSSAAFEVVSAFVLGHLNGIEMDPVQMALLCQRAENRFVKVNCGIMDQFAATLSKKNHALFLDCRSLEFQYVPLEKDNIAVVICDSGVKRGLVDSEYNARRQQCVEGVKSLSQTLPNIKALREVSIEQLAANSHILTPVVEKRCRHVVSENLRVNQAIDALRSENMSQFGTLMNESHISLRDDYEVSCRELDILVEIAWKTDGVLGARLTGAGFGGCTVNIVLKEALDAFSERISKEYQSQTGLKTQIYACLAEDGVSELSTGL